MDACLLYLTLPDGHGLDLVMYMSTNRVASWAPIRTASGLGYGWPLEDAHTVAMLTGISRSLGQFLPLAPLDCQVRSTLHSSLRGPLQ